LREDLARAVHQLDRAGLNHASTGNTSVRHAGGMLITPSGIPAAELDADAMVALGLDGTATPGQQRPSSEWRLHAAVYAARPDVSAVVHAHPAHATALACARRSIPPLHYMIAAAGGCAIPCSRYATFGTPELADEVVKVLGPELRACLMANHGLLAAGPHLAGAVALAQEVEHLARIYLLTLQAGGPVLLDGAELGRVRERFRDYERL
jgi:L-fuculose-phosphate aldolase